MLNRITLKENGKAAFQRNYWKCVLVALIAVIALSSSFTFSSKRGYETANTAAQTSFRQEMTNTIRSAPVTIGLTGGLGFSLLHIFLFSVLEIGCDKFFIKNVTGEAEFDQVLDGFRSGYGKNVLTLFLARLFIALWSLLFVIPGIVKSYSYMLVPFILADSPEMPRREALHLSEDLMHGHKMDAFVLDLSFIGWEILNALTFGILGVFYVNPYVQATKTELYLSLRYNMDSLNSLNSLK